MPLAVSYTEHTLAAYLSDVIGPDMAGALVWTVGNDDPGSYAGAVNAALRALGLSDVADATDLAQLEAAARVAVWNRAAQHLAAMPRTSVVDTGADLETLYQHAVAERKAARVDAMRTGLSYAVTSTAVTYTDLFSHVEDES